MDLLMETLLLRLGGDYDIGGLCDRLLDLLAIYGVLLEHLIEVVYLVLRDVDVEAAKLVAELLVALRLADLTLQRADLTLHLAQYVRLAKQVLLGLVDLAKGLLAVGLELRDSGGLFEHGAAVFRLGRENRVDLTLRHDGV